MSIYFDLHGHRLNLQALEANIMQRHYDHSNPPLIGWRAERKAVEMTARNNKPITGKIAFGKRWRIARSMTQIVRNCLGRKAAG